MTYLIDTAAAVRKIEQTGLSRNQAEAIVSTISETGEQVATKSDIELLRKDIENSSMKTRAWIATGFVAAIGTIKALDHVLPMLIN